jgi:hypothetical protein
MLRKLVGKFLTSLREFFGGYKDLHCESGAIVRLHNSGASETLNMAQILTSPEGKKMLENMSRMAENYRRGYGERKREV